MAAPKVITPELRSGPHGPGKPNAATQKIRDDRAVAQAKGERYVRPVTPANTKSASARGTAPPGQVNRPTQAIRDARAVAKAGGDRYTRKVEKYVNKATQAKRVERAKAGRQVKTPPVVVAPPSADSGWTDAMQEAHDKAMAAYGGAWNAPDAPYNVANENASYVADPNRKYQDPNDLLSQIKAAVVAGKSQVKLPSGEKWATNRATIDLILANLARDAAEASTKGRKND